MDRATLREKKIGVLMGGTSSEREISLNSGRAILAGLLRCGYNAVGVDVGSRIDEQLRKEVIDVAYVALHGRRGEDGTVQGLLEVMGIPYTGSGVLASAVSMDKCVMKLLLVSLNLPSPAYRACTDEGESDFFVPCVVKPAREGSTIGISIVKDKSELEGAVKKAFQYDCKLLIEKYVAGREITVGIVNGTVLPIVEVRPLSGFYDFTSKYTKGMTEYIVPAELDKKISDRAHDVAQAIWDNFGLAGCARIDMLLDGETPMVIDINTSPGMTETSLVPKAWMHLQRTFDQLVEEILMGAGLKA